MNFEKEVSRSPDAEVVGNVNTILAVKTGHNEIFLIPRPSDDPLDPLVSILFL